MTADPTLAKTIGGNIATERKARNLMGECVERGTAGVGVLVLGRIFAPRKTWTAAVNAARALLGETEAIR